MHPSMGTEVPAPPKCGFRVYQYPKCGEWYLHCVPPKCGLGKCIVISSSDTCTQAWEQQYLHHTSKCRLKCVPLPQAWGMVPAPPSPSPKLSARWLAKSGQGTLHWLMPLPCPCPSLLCPP